MLTPEARKALRDCFERFAAYLDVKKVQAKKTLVAREKLDWLP